MLAKQLLIIGIPRTIGFGVAPAIQDVSTLARVPTGMPCGFLCCRAVIDNVNLVRVLTRKCNLV